MNLIDVNEQFSTDEQCLAYLEAARWPDGVRCPVCGCERISRIQRKKAIVERKKPDGSTRKHKQRIGVYQCLEETCKEQFSATQGTIFNKSHIPLHKWFLALALVIDAKKGMSAKQLEAHLGLGSYRTAWYMAHRIRKAMDVPNNEFPKMTGVVEMDETYLGGRTVRPYGGRSNKKKDIVVALRERGGNVRLMHVDDVKASTLKQIAEEFISDDVDAIVTDDFKSYPLALKKFKGKHHRINHSLGYYVTGDQNQIHTNTVESAFSLFKRGLLGSYHIVSIKHLHRYLAEFEFRFNERKNADRFQKTLGRMMQAEPMPYATITASPEEKA
jgi:transposase-like protein